MTLKAIILSLMVSTLLQEKVTAFTTFATKYRHQTSLHSTSSDDTTRRQFVYLSSLLITTVPTIASADDGESITERAARIAREMEGKEVQQRTPTSSPSSSTTPLKTVYDFSLPVAGVSTPISELVDQTTCKAILVVNIKQDDPQARKNIPALLSLANRYGSKGLSIIAIPTDQGYYEPDTSILIRLKLASEYGYDTTKNPSTILADKINLLGTGANPFMKWLQGKCRTPSGLGKIQANFEKFLINGKTGLPLRRYPRKYSPMNISDDIEALLNSKASLPPPVGNYQEEWRTAAKEAETDTYRFQKGINVFDQ